MAENCRPVGAGGVGHLADQLILSQPGGVDCAHCITIVTPGFAGLSTALNCEMLNGGADFDLGHQLATEISVENHLPTRLKIIDPQEHSHEERCAIIDAHTLTTIPTTFVFLTTQLSVRFLENIWLTRR